MRESSVYQMIIERGIEQGKQRSVPATFAATAHGVCLLPLRLRHTECACYLRKGFRASLASTNAQQTDG